jgi:hypothetical protein
MRIRQTLHNPGGKKPTLVLLICFLGNTLQLTGIVKP